MHIPMDEPAGARSGHACAALQCWPDVGLHALFKLSRVRVKATLGCLLLAGMGGLASAALVTQPPDTGTGAAVASGGSRADADRPANDLLPPGLLVPKAIDLLLDMHVDAVNLAYTPMEATASAVMAGGLDVRSLNPNVPANPMFPGYGLSYEPPPADGTGRKAIAPQAADEVGPGAGAQADAAAKAEAAESWREGPRDRLADARDWIADHRMELLVGMGVAVVLGAAVVASRSRLSGGSSRGRSASSRSASRGSGEGSSRRSGGRVSGSSDARGTR